MNYNYLIVIFKNKVKNKLINKFKTKERAFEYFKKIKKEMNSVIFPVRYKNGNSVNLEVALLSTKQKESYYTKDELGRQVKIVLKDEDYSISEIMSYQTEEKFLDYQTKKKINSKILIEKYLIGSGIKMISKLNNKIIVQNDDDINLFTFKNNTDSERFLDCLHNYFFEKNKKDCLIVKDTSTTQRKYLYELLVEKGYDKKYLFRRSTTHSSKKQY